MSVIEFIDSLDVPNLLDRLKAEHKGEFDHHWYEPTWYNALQRIVGEIRNGERSVSRVLERTTAFRKRQDFFGELRPHYWLGRLEEAPAMQIHFQRRALRNATLHGACERGTQSVIELGSGPSFHLFWFWLAGAPRRARYMAFEITRTGRLCTEILAHLEPDMKVSAHPFDYYAPDYSAIPSGQEHMVVYTCGSIEQIRTLPKEVFTGLLDKAKRITVLHFEPVGWQMIDESSYLPSTVAIKQRCLKFGYNENLWPLLKELEAEGRITIQHQVIDAFGKHNNPATFIQWTATRAGQ